MIALAVEWGWIVADETSNNTCGPLHDGFDDGKRYIPSSSRHSPSSLSSIITSLINKHIKARCVEFNHGRTLAILDE